MSNSKGMTRVVFRTIVSLEALPLSCSVFAVYECVGLQHVCLLICIVSACLFACGLLATVQLLQSSNLFIIDKSQKTPVII